MAGLPVQSTGRHGYKNPDNTLQEDKWELYNTNEDFSLANDLASQNADKLKAMQDLFMAEAEKYHVLPLDDRLLERTNAELMGRPTVMGNRNYCNLWRRHERNGC